MLKTVGMQSATAHTVWSGKVAGLDPQCIIRLGLPGWVECAGCADRGSYDLTQHSKITGEKLTVERLNSDSSVEEVHPHVVEPSFGELVKILLI